MVSDRADMMLCANASFECAAEAGLGAAVEGSTVEAATGGSSSQKVWIMGPAVSYCCPVDASFSIRRSRRRLDGSKAAGTAMGSEEPCEHAPVS